MKKTLYAITTLVCACFAINASSQEITGLVINTAGQPLEYVNIVLLQATDSTYIEGTTTRNDGTFMMAQPKVKAFMRISYIGYTTKTMDLRPNVGKIVMEEDTKLLGEVTVKAHRRIFEMGKEGMVTNVAGHGRKCAGIRARDNKDARGAKRVWQGHTGDIYQWKANTRHLGT